MLSSPDIHTKLHHCALWANAEKFESDLRLKALDQLEDGVSSVLQGISWLAGCWGETYRFVYSLGNQLELIPSQQSTTKIKGSRTAWQVTSRFESICWHKDERQFSPQRFLCLPITNIGESIVPDWQEYIPSQCILSSICFSVVNWTTSASYMLRNWRPKNFFQLEFGDVEL